MEELGGNIKKGYKVKPINFKDNKIVSVDCEENGKIENIEGSIFVSSMPVSYTHLGKCLTVKWKNISSGTEVVQYEWNEGDNQKWIIRDNGDGSVGIIPLSDYSLTIDIYGAIENGSKLELYNNERNVKQRFTLIKSNLGVNIDRCV